MPEEKNTVYDAFVPVVREQVADRIRAIREEAEFSQAELAEKIGRRQAYISDMETGKTEPNATMLVVLALTLNKPIAYFFPEDYRYPLGWAITAEELTVEEQRLIKEIRKLEPHFDYHELTIRIIKAIVEYQEDRDEFLNR